MKYRKKPVVVEAMQWDGTGRGATAIVEWIEWHGGKAVYRPSGWDYPTQPAIIYFGNELDRTIISGDWIVLDPAEGFHRLPALDFEATYEPVEESEPALSGHMRIAEIFPPRAK